MEPWKGWIISIRHSKLHKEPSQSNTSDARLAFLMDGFACLLHPVWQKILQNLGILINPDLKLTLSDLGSIRVPNPWRRHELGIYVTSTKEVQRYVVIIHFGSIDPSAFLFKRGIFNCCRATRFDDSKIEDRLSNYRQLAKLSASFVGFIVGRILY